MGNQNEINHAIIGDLISIDFECLFCSTGGGTTAKMKKKRKTYANANSDEYVKAKLNINLGNFFPSDKRLVDLTLKRLINIWK